MHELDPPWLLRPFAGAVCATIERKAEAQSEALENFREYDVVILDEQAEGRYVLVGLRRDVVDDAIAHFGRAADKQDLATRRKIAQRLFTVPTRRSWMTHPGLAYALKVLVDEAGLVHEILVLDEGGQVGMKFSYLSVNGQPAWQAVLATFASNVKTLGYLEGQLKVNFADHKLDQSPQWNENAPGRRVDDHDGGNNSPGPDPQP